MKYKIRLKGLDAFVRVDALPEEDRKLVEQTILKDVDYISWDAEKEFSQVVQTLKYDKVPFLRRDINKIFSEQSEPIFKYLMGLSSHSLWIEINRTSRNANSWEKRKDWLFGLKRFEYHHYLIDKEQTEDIIPTVPYAPVIFFYSSLEDLVNDIKKEYNKRIDKDKHIIYNGGIEGDDDENI